MKKRTKIIASLGPASSSGVKLEKMLHAGTDVFRINLSHTKIEDAKKIIDLVRAKEKKIGRPVAIMLDLQGQKIRIKGLSKKPHVILKIVIILIYTQNEINTVMKNKLELQKKNGLI